MTREEAKAVLYEWQEMMVRNGVPIDTSKVQALRVAIEALSAPTEGDLISRADAMGAVQDHFNADGFKGYYDGQQMMDRIKALPSARPTGLWIQLLPKTAERE